MKEINLEQPMEYGMSRMIKMIYPTQYVQISHTRKDTLMD